MNYDLHPHLARLLRPALVCALILALVASPACRSCRSNPTPKQAEIPNLPFGNPSGAGSDPDNRLVLRPQFAASWNQSQRIANWVAWRLVAGDIGETERSQFYTDSEIPTPTPKDYTNSGYDRGHLCPSKDRSDTPENNQAVFTMLNIFPQAPDNNRGPWEKLERFERALAEAGREVYVITGGAGSRGKIAGHINVPATTWKIIVALEPGRSYPDGQEKAMVFAVALPNENGIRERRWQDFQTTAPEIERLTGCRFFSLAPIIALRAQEKRFEAAD
ncbi:MAG TPA: DNA/RNA non-specific endonuclease [Blastocatellia bacterium]|nr:DNA/RNA non-specific endonuclease [Blastocatellia bacterium]